MSVVLLGLLGIIMTWKSEGAVTNPLQDSVLADTGPLIGDGALTVVALFSSTVPARFTFQYRNAQNDTSINSQEFALPGQGQFMIENLPYQELQRFRIVSVASIVGSVQCSLMY